MTSSEIAAASPVGRDVQLFRRYLVPVKTEGDPAGAADEVERLQRALARAEWEVTRLSGEVIRLQEQLRYEERRREMILEEADRAREGLAAAERVRDLVLQETRSLHQLLELWRRRMADVEATSALRARRRIVHWRSRVEGRPQTGSAYPCVIGATGGSGTRVFARIAEAGGLWIGADRNPAEDARPIEAFLRGWLIPYWEGGGNQPPYAAPPGMDEALEAALIEQFTGASPLQPRGWKNPRNLYVLPYLAQRFPDLRFIHVVRDGRDMALSENQNQLISFSSVLLTPEEQQWTQEERSIALWTRINGWAAQIGHDMGRSYLRVRFEDLCAHPEPVTRRILRFFELPGSARTAARLVEAPASVGRWRDADPVLIARLEEIGRRPRSLRLSRSVATA